MLSTCALGAATTAHAESWRTGVELIDQWSIFTCVASLPDRYWDFTLEGSQLSAVGPEGAKWTTQVGETGSFKTTFTGLWRGRPFEGEVSGNAKGKWALMHNKTALCWYRLEPKAVADPVVTHGPSEWTSVSAISHGTCWDGVFARIKEQPGALRLTLADGGAQFAQFDVALAADGSGQAEYRGTNGAPTRLEIPAGSGKRILRSARLDGTCQWVWEPI
jgi:hypothetical protein